MKNFQHVNPETLDQASALLTSDAGAFLIAGGIDLLGEMKSGTIRPGTLINLKALRNLSYIKFNDQDGLRIGALTTLAEIAAHPEIRKNFGALAQAAHSVATPQIRNMGTLGGNLCQRPRCWYYRHASLVCLRKGGKECLAVAGENKYNAILGGGPDFIVHPSDCAPALIALGAEVTVYGPHAPRTMELENFFLFPKENVRRENRLQPGELLTEVHVPTPSAGARTVYLKVKERGSWDFALASVAVCLLMSVTGECKDVRIVLGGVAPAPWRSPEAEKVCLGKKIDERTAIMAGKSAVADAVPLGKNDYKVELAANLVKRALLMCATTA